MMADRGAAVEAALERWNERRRRIFYPKTDDAGKPPPAGEADYEMLPETWQLSEEALGVERLAGGTCHKIFRVRTASKNWIFKRSWAESDFGFAIENRIMTQLRQLGLPALRVYGFNVLADSLSPAFILIEEAPGRTLTSFENPESQRMPEPLLFEFGRLLATIHQIPATGAGLVDCAKEGWVGLHAAWRDYLLLRLDEHLEVCRSLGAIDERESIAIESAFAIIDEVPIRLLHGDPGHHNVFSDGHKITAIIDWEDALCGDPIFDIAYWGTFVRDEMRQRFLDGYQTVHELPDDFERRYWLYYLRVALSKTVHRHRFGIQDRPGRPPASRRIQKALSNLAKL